MRVCFVGAGSIGKRHIRNLYNICRQKDIKCEIDLLRSSETALGNELEPYINKQYFAKDDIEHEYDIIFITNPTYKHFETIGQLKKYAPNFFVEKPIFDSSNVSVDSLELPVENKYYVACPLRYTGVLLDARDIVKNEAVYSVRAISSSYLPEWRPGSDYRKNYSAHKDEGGGVRIDLIHEWDYLVSLFGFPVKTYSYSGKYSHLEIDSEDLAVYIGEYPDKLVELHLDYFGRRVRRELEIRTNLHEYVFDIQQGRIFQNGNMIKDYQEDINERYIREMEYFLKIVLNGQENVNDLKTAKSILDLSLNDY